MVVADGASLGRDKRERRKTKRGYVRGRKSHVIAPLGRVELGVGEDQ